MSLELPTEIANFFPSYEPHVVKNLLTVTEGVFEAQSTNLNKVKLKLPNILNTKSNIDAHYKRLYRFFRDNGENQEDMMRCLVRISLYILGIQKGKGRHVHYLTQYK